MSSTVLNSDIKSVVCNVPGGFPETGITCKEGMTTEPAIVEKVDVVDAPGAF